jgi:diguanylate cyclase (GGDEF)-like protein
VTIINTLLTIQMNIFMLILLSSIAVYTCFESKKGDQANRLFSILTFLTIAQLILEILSVVLNSSYYSNFIVAHKAVDTLGFALAPTVPIVAAFYTYKRTNKSRKIPINYWLTAPLAVNTLLSLGSYHYNWIFNITDENLYTRGPLFLVSPVTSYFYYTVHLIVVYRNRKKVNKEELIGLGCLTLIPAALSVVQLYYFIYLTIWNSVAIAVIINYIIITRNRAKYDPLTGLGNRTAYDEYIASLSGQSSIVLSVINIDMDDFKSINDVFGHKEGDRVLQLFAGQLKKVFDGAGVIIRLGGDEFLIFLNMRNRIILEQRIKELNDRIEAYNESSNKPYRIQFSYGIAIFDDSYANIHEFIQHSDKLMYEEKRKKQYQR